ncbi:unnamed protein product [Candidula unifasciata]|uniref:Carboxylic ester hydrolase n=1 Tax=Candidula unifasciata TaxID=100452 RepID=A0A8S3YNS8_9EUPU|nr:unnamed protein product [Candidula unifasciata]
MTMLSILISLALIFPVLVQPAPEIQLPDGKVQGVDKQAQASQKPYIAFYGIPFAKPPVNELRFKPPQPFVGTGPDVVISSDKFRPACLQSWPDPSKVINEDCLYLNVYTPPDLTKLRKVMFWIHGGGFKQGDATQYVPSQLVTDKDVIVVTTQYRLGIFGFLTSQNGDGNNGLRDQILALNWTKNNIQSFGGDPNDITIFGESAGSASVSFLALSPLTKGLFTKAIMQSGTAFSGWAINRHPSLLLDIVSEKLGCTASLFYLFWFKQIRSIDKINCIKNKSVSELLNVIPETQDIADSLNSDKLFIPVIDGDVLPQSPESLLANVSYLRSNGILDRDYIMGCTNNEGLILFASQMVTEAGIGNFTAASSAEKFIKAASNLLSPNNAIEADKLQLIYYQYSYPRDEDEHAPLQDLLDIATDVLFAVPTVQLARALTQASNSTNVYLYLYDHGPELLKPDGLFRGSTHGLDLSYEFDLSEISNLQSFYALPPQPSEKNLTELFLTVLSQFAKTGSPLGPPGQEPQVWPRYNRKDEHFFRISLTPKNDQHLFAKRVALWTDIVLKSNSQTSKPWRGFRRH